jgi:diguanylate cyclase (GGDEF)-like protein
MLDDDGRCMMTGTVAVAAPGSRRWWQDWGALLVAACGLGVLAFVAYYLSGAGSEPTRRWVTDFTYIPVATASMLLCLRASWRPGLDSRTRWAWRVFGMAAGWKLFADVAWWWLDASSHQTVSFPSLADAGFLGAVPITFAALLLLPGRRLTRSQWFRLTLDIATVAAGGFMLLWYLVLGPTLASGGTGPLAAVAAAAYPIGDLVLLVGMVTVLLRGAGRGSRRPLQVMLLSLALYVIADTYYGYVNLHGGFVGGTWPDLFFMTAQFLFAVAAQAQCTGALHAAADEGDGRLRHSVSRLPYLAVLVGYAVLVGIARNEALYPLGGLLIGAVVLTGLVAVRQMTALRDNECMIVTDHLTGLANRALLHSRLGRALARTNGGQVAVLLIDLDGFKDINDAYGHEAGDRVLVGFADVLRGCVRQSDLAARLGGDEFAVMLPGVRDTAAAVAAASRILNGLQKPIEMSGRPLRIRCSIGIAVSDEDMADPKELLHRADTAMYDAKRHGQHGVAVYGENLDEADLRRSQLRADLRRAIERREFVLHYQPIVALHDGSVTGVEALVRWQHPALGMVPPEEFLPIAGENRQIGEIGAWVLERACAQLEDWRRSHPGGRQLSLNVNLAPQQLSDPTIVTRIEDILARTGFDPAALVLELTEGVVLHDSLDTVLRLSALRQRGVRIAIDDFGTGYSSLGYLTRLPIDILKIDRCFVAEMGSGSEASAVAHAVIRLSQALRLETVADGIELESQATGMRQLGCSLGQGYYFARPLDATAMEAFLDQMADAPDRPTLPESLAS